MSVIVRVFHKIQANKIAKVVVSQIYITAKKLQNYTTAAK